MLSQIRLNIQNNTYLKDPNSSELGRKIIESSIVMLEELGFENFTFRKLAQKINSTEASVYRYFESKHKLLLYLATWYWSWMEYRFEFITANIDCPKTRLSKSIELLAGKINSETELPFENKEKLNRIIVNEASKTYLNKNVDSVNKEGVFMGYKSLVGKIAEIILEINPNYKYSNMLITTVVEGVHHQRFFAEHLPKLTNVVNGEDTILTFYKNLVFKAIEE